MDVDPLGSMGLEYLPTFGLSYGKCRFFFTIHGSYGYGYAAVSHGVSIVEVEVATANVDNIYRNQNRQLLRSSQIYILKFPNSILPGFISFGDNLS